MSKSWFFDKDFSGVPDNFFEYVLGRVDFPMEDVEPNDDGGEDWESKFRHLEPPPSNLLTTFSTSLCAEDASSLEPNYSSCSVLLKQCPSSAEASSSRSKPILCQSSDSKYSHHFQATSPVSVLESIGSSCSTENATAYYPKFVAPVKRPRSKQPRPRRRTFPFIPIACASKKFYRLASPDPEFEYYNDEEILDSARKRQKKRNMMLLSSAVEMAPKMKPVETRRCTHCQVTKTPQWREGPLGPKTLCNACGVRYRSGRLLPEYRPALSPTFVPFLHSNSHRKVLEMRKQAEQVTPMEAMDEVGTLDDRMFSSSGSREHPYEAEKRSSGVQNHQCFAFCPKANHSSAMAQHMHLHPYDDRFLSKGIIKPKTHACIGSVCSDIG